MKDDPSFLTDCPSKATATDPSLSAPAPGSGFKLRSAEDFIISKDDQNLCLGSGELLPCPFCGSLPISLGERTPSERAVCYKVLCTGLAGLVPNCTASTWGTDPDEAKAREMAVSRWNRRAGHQNTKEADPR